MKARPRPFPVSPQARRAGLVGATVGVVAAGVAMGVAVERRLVARAWRRGGVGDGTALADLPPLRGIPTTVAADDDVRLYAEVDDLSGGADADEAVPDAAGGVQEPSADVPDAAEEAHGLNVVFCHGYALHSEAWRFQRQALREAGGVRRLVFYDQRGHGRSGRGRRENATIDQLGRDLACVIDELASEGPVVLVGHSMGGMTVMALAEARPELFGERIAGVALISTSPGKLAEVTLGVPSAVARVVHRVVPPVVAALGRAPTLAERGRRFSSDVELLLTRQFSFASAVPPVLVEWAASMISRTPVDVLAELFPAFDAHDKMHALPVLDAVETLLLCGDSDLMTPPDHTRAMAEALPAAEVVLVPDAGHMVLAEYPEIVNAALLRLLERVQSSPS